MAFNKEPRYTGVRTVHTMFLCIEAVQLLFDFNCAAWQRTAAVLSQETSMQLLLSRYIATV